MMNYQCIVSGKVQGVFYRSHVQKMASDIGLNGYVRNLLDGNVEACVTIYEDKELDKFLEILKQGSPYSRVDNVKTQICHTSFNNGFTVLR